MLATTTISVIELVNLTQGIATLNLGYLGLCVTIILFVGGFFYVFNFKPLQESIKKQESQLEGLKKEIELKIENMNTGFVNFVSTQTTELRAIIDLVAKETNSIKKDAFDKINNAEKQFSAFTAKAEQELSGLRREYQVAELNNLWYQQYIWGGWGAYKYSKHANGVY